MFDWWNKPEVMLTPKDNLIICAEVLLITGILIGLIFIISFIPDIIKNFKKKLDKKKERKLIHMKSFSYKEIKDKKTGSIYITNSEGCSWQDGVGVSPNGHFCGECTNICKKVCDQRSMEDNGL